MLPKTRNQEAKRLTRHSTNVGLAKMAISRPTDHGRIRQSLSREMCEMKWGRPSPKFSWWIYLRTRHTRPADNHWKAHPLRGLVHHVAWHNGELPIPPVG